MATLEALLDEMFFNSVHHMMLLTAASLFFYFFLFIYLFIFKRLQVASLRQYDQGALRGGSVNTGNTLVLCSVLAATAFMLGIVEGLGKLNSCSSFQSETQYLGSA